MTNEAFKTLKKACLNNPGKCALVVLGGAYVASAHGSMSTKQKNCIQECLPENFPMREDPLNFPLVPRDAASTDDHPICKLEPLDDCEAFCTSKCKAAHPRTLVGSIVDGVDNMLNDVISPITERLFGVSYDDIKFACKIALVVAVMVVLVKILLKIKALFATKKRPQVLKIIS